MERALISSLTLLLSLQFCLADHTGVVAESCGWEQFSGECPPGSALLVKSARYGRMRVGRCVQRAFGHIGCGVDATHKLHLLCSGRRTCTFAVSAQLHGDHDCPNDLQAYVEVHYACMPVVACESSLCRDSGLMRPAAPSGYLSSEATWESGCGGSTCPWLLEAGSGQRVNLTLYDFSDPDPQQLDKMCWKYASVRSADAVSQDLTVCAGDAHPSARSYLSQGPSLRLTMHTPESRDHLMYYLIKFEVVGCEGPSIPEAARVSLRSDDLIVIECEHLQRSWELRCEAGSWRGDLGSCIDEASSDFVRGDTSHTVGMLLVVGLGVMIGVVVGGLLLGLALCVIRRRNKRRTQREASAETRLMGEHAFYDVANHRYAMENDKNCIPMVQKLVIPPRREPHDYTCTLPHHMSPKDSRSPGVVSTTSPGFCSSPAYPVEPRKCYASDCEDVSFTPPPDFMVHTVSRDHMMRPRGPPCDHSRSCDHGGRSGDHSGKVHDHIYETPRFPIEDVPKRGVGARSADGICPADTSGEGKSSVTS